MVSQQGFSWNTLIDNLFIVNDRLIANGFDELRKGFNDEQL